MSESEAEATHLVHSAADPLEEEYARPILRRERNTLLHWYVKNIYTVYILIMHVLLMVIFLVE